MLNVNDKAPDFSLKDAEGNTVSLSDLLGKRTVLYFYPKDSTPGCTRQACAFSAEYGEFKRLGVNVVGISRDSEKSHGRFAEKYSLPFTLLSDPTGEVHEKYGVLKNKKLYGRTFLGTERTTFIINEEGYITTIMRKVKPDTNAKDVIAAL